MSRLGSGMVKQIESIGLELFSFSAGLQSLCSIGLSQRVRGLSERGQPHEPVPHIFSPCRRRLRAARLGFVARHPGGRTHGDVSLAGTWTLVTADVMHPDGSRSHDYGDAPKGLLMVDREGRYSLQIFRSDRVPFANPDKAKATAQE